MELVLFVPVHSSLLTVHFALFSSDSSKPINAFQPPDRAESVLRFDGPLKPFPSSLETGKTPSAFATWSPLIKAVITSPGNDTMREKRAAVGNRHYGNIANSRPCWVEGATVSARRRFESRDACCSRLPGNEKQRPLQKGPPQGSQRLRVKEKVLPPA